MAEKTVLSARMQAVADMVTPKNRVCDVGCDHGFISIYLVQNKIIPAALAMDVRKGPLERARAHVEQAGLSDYIELRLSDGLSAYQPGEAQSLILAGMGGPLIQRILSHEESKSRSFSEFILQPQSEVRKLRAFLRNKKYAVIAEDMVMEEGKFYPIIRAVPIERVPYAKEEAELWDGESSQAESGKVPDELADRFGAILLRDRHVVLQDYLKVQKEKLCKLIKELKQAEGERAFSRTKELVCEMEYLQQAAKICNMEGWDGNNNDERGIQAVPEGNDL